MNMGQWTRTATRKAGKKQALASLVRPMGPSHTASTYAGQGDHKAAQGMHAGMS